MRDKDPHRYDFMLDMEPPEPTTMPRMSRRNRAAQFVGFRALTGYDELIEEAVRHNAEEEEIKGEEE